MSLQDIIAGEQMTMYDLRGPWANDVKKEIILKQINKRITTAMTKAWEAGREEGERFKKVQRLKKVQKYSKYPASFS